jgi:hypothetical protein
MMERHITRVSDAREEAVGTTLHYAGALERADVS